MKAKKVIFVMAFFLFFSLTLNAQVKGLQWNTFMGAATNDSGNEITRDSSGNLFVVGESFSTWGSPLNAYNGGEDVFVAKLDSTGNLLWHTFLGSSSGDDGYGIIHNSSGQIYVIGRSEATWADPVNDHNGMMDAFVACLDSSGNLLWNTFLGSYAPDRGIDIGLDSSGNIYVAGHSSVTWGSPISVHSGEIDVFVAKLNSSGSLLWHTFLGCSSNDNGFGIAMDSSGNSYVTGFSDATWKSPVNAHSGLSDAFVAKVDSSGNLVWNTFLGSANSDSGRKIAIGNIGNIYVVGDSYLTGWGSPVNSHSGMTDAFVACLDSSGNLVWNTFLGSSSNDWGRGIIRDKLDNVYVIGQGDATWGTPVNAHSSAGTDVFVAGLDSSGNLIWNTFLGAGGFDDSGFDIILNSSNSIFVTGMSWATWGSPVNAHSGGLDAFVAELSTLPLPDIKANGSDGSVTISQFDTLQIRVSLASFGSTANVDYWLAYKGPSGWVHFDNSTKKWLPGLDVTHQGVLMTLNNIKVFQSSGLAPGNYTFYFGVDMDMNGKVTKSSLYKDEVQVTVTSN